MDIPIIIAILTVLGSGVSAGIVTFWMNFWKAELDFRRVKIEELYAAVHKCATAAQIISVNININLRPFEGVSIAIEDVDRIHLLIELYFPSLLPTFKDFRLNMIATSQLMKIASGEVFHKEVGDNFQRLANLGDKLKAEVIGLSRKGSLRALIEAVQEYDSKSRG
jgi:hypothetical protein